MKRNNLIFMFRKLHFLVSQFLQKFREGDKDNFSNNPYCIF